MSLIKLIVLIILVYFAGDLVTLKVIWILIVEMVTFSDSYHVGFDTVDLNLLESKLNSEYNASLIVTQIVDF